jgi:RNA polymerase-binding transcription factor DksA
MAKSAKKSASKAAKKPVAAKPAKKLIKKSSSEPKPKKVVKAVVKKVAKKVTEKKVVVAKKPTLSKKPAKRIVTKKLEEKKVELKKVPVARIEKKTLEPKAKKVAKEKVLKEQNEPIGLSTPASRKQEAMAIPKVSPQLTMFQIPTVRPIAHKSTVAPSNSQDKTRYSDEELKEFEILIKSKLEKANEEFKILKGTLNRTDDAGTDATSGGNTKVLEDGAETAEKENLSQLAARQLKYMTNLENALIRIKNGTYGICSVTGKLISKERLIAVPHTTQSIEAKMMNRD